MRVFFVHITIIAKKNKNVNPSNWRPVANEIVGFPRVLSRPVAKRSLGKDLQEGSELRFPAVYSVVRDFGQQLGGDLGICFLTKTDILRVINFEKRRTP